MATHSFATLFLVAMLQTATLTSALVQHATGHRPRVVRRSAAPDAWSTFAEHHARGDWMGVRTTYNAASGTVAGDDAIAIVQLSRKDDGTVAHAMKVPTTEVQSSGCDRCASTIDFRTIPLGELSADKLGRFSIDGRGAAVGPTMLRSGGCSFEISLAADARRVAVSTSYAPEWADGIPGGPPDALVLRKVSVSRELCAGGMFPDTEVDGEFYRAAETREEAGDRFALDAPGGISVTAAKRIAAGAPAPVAVRWRPTAAPRTPPTQPSPRCRGRRSSRASRRRT